MKGNRRGIAPRDGASHRSIVSFLSSVGFAMLRRCWNSQVAGSYARSAAPVPDPTASILRTHASVQAGGRRDRFRSAAGMVEITGSLSTIRRVAARKNLRIVTNLMTVFESSSRVKRQLDGRRSFLFPCYGPFKIAGGAVPLQQDAVSANRVLEVDGRRLPTLYALRWDEQFTGVFGMHPDASSVTRAGYCMPALFCGIAGDGNVQSSADRLRYGASRRSLHADTICFLVELEDAWHVRVTRGMNPARSVSRCSERDDMGAQWW